MNVRHCCQMAQLVAKEIAWFEQGWNSPSHTRTNRKKCRREKTNFICNISLQIQELSCHWQPLISNSNFFTFSIFDLPFLHWMNIKKKQWNVFIYHKMKKVTKWSLCYKNYFRRRYNCFIFWPAFGWCALQMPAFSVNIPSFISKLFLFLLRLFPNSSCLYLG